MLKGFVLCYYEGEEELVINEEYLQKLYDNIMSDETQAVLLNKAAN